MPDSIQRLIPTLMLLLYGIFSDNFTWLREESNVATVLIHWNRGTKFAGKTERRQRAIKENSLLIAVRAEENLNFV